MFYFCGVLNGRMAFTKSPSNWPKTVLVTESIQSFGYEASVRSPMNVKCWYGALVYFVRLFTSTSSVLICIVFMPDSGYSIAWGPWKGISALLLCDILCVNTIYWMKGKQIACCRDAGKGDIQSAKLIAHSFYPTPTIFPIRNRPRPLV